MTVLIDFYSIYNIFARSTRLGTAIRVPDAGYRTLSVTGRLSGFGIMPPKLVTCVVCPHHVYSIHYTVTQSDILTTGCLMSDAVYSV